MNRPDFVGARHRRAQNRAAARAAPTIFNFWAILELPLRFKHLNPLGSAC